MSPSVLGRDAVRDRLHDPWPLPADGRTRLRWSALTALGEADLPLAKLVEPHHDAIAILSDLAVAPVGSDDIWAVWAAEPPFAVLTATETTMGWTLTGRKAFCSGAELATHALVTAETPEGSRLMAVDLADPGISIDPEGQPWAGSGMARAGTAALAFDSVQADAVGPADAYTDRPGFWWGAIGIAAIWLGGARGIARTLELAAARLDAHGTAHLGAVRAELDGLSLMLDASARIADESTPSTDDVQRLALVVRERASAVVDTVISHVGRALGPAPLAFDAKHAARVADLQVFVRQHHAERDLAQLGSWGSADA